MNCPHCKEDLSVIDAAYRNADTYGKTVTVRADCCGNAIRLRPVRHYEATKYVGNETSDDWGQPIKNPARAALRKGRETTAFSGVVATPPEQKERLSQLSGVVEVSEEDEYCTCETPTLGGFFSQCGTCDKWFKEANNPTRKY